MSITSFGREQYNTYRSPLLNEKIFDIDISYKSSGEYTLYVQMISMDKLLDDGGIMINNVYHELFLSKLNEAKVKYVEWSLTAKENNVINFSKLMKYKVRVGSYFKYGNEYHSQYGAKLDFTFTVIGGISSLVIGTRKLTSSSNQYMTHDGFIFVFRSEKEIDDFIDILSVYKVETFMTEPKTKDLFKD